MRAQPATARARNMGVRNRRLIMRIGAGGVYRVRNGKYRACPRIQQPGYGKSSDAGELPEGSTREVTFCFRHDVCELRPHAAPFGASKPSCGGMIMLWTIVVILLILWALGLFVGTVGNLIHILLVIAIIVVLVRVIQGRRPI